MLMILVAGIPPLLIVTLAIRFILKWVLPKPAFDRVCLIVDRTMMTFTKLIVIAVAGLIVFVVWHGVTHTP